MTRRVLVRIGGVERTARVVQERGEWLRLRWREQRGERTVNHTATVHRSEVTEAGAACQEEG